MKTLFCFFLFAFTPAARATTVVITVTGHVSETDASAFFTMPPVSVGDMWTVTLSYPHPSPPVDINLSGYNYGGVGMNHRLTFTVNSLQWSGDFGLRADPEAPFENIDIVGSLSVPSQIIPGAGGPSSIRLMMGGGSDIIGDRASLPESFSDWNLPGANSFSLENLNRYDVPGNAWHIRANSWDTMTIQVIPEPTALSLTALAITGVVGRRRRVMV